LRKTNSSALVSAALATLLVAFGTGEASAVTIDTVPVGNAGNGNDMATGNLYGGVAYAYHIGKTDVTNAQYAEFLNAKAQSDPFALCSSNMGDAANNNFGGITHSGSACSCYATITGRGNTPMNYVRWCDSIRFTNWLNDGQGSVQMGPVDLQKTLQNLPSCDIWHSLSELK
jgi:Sulfatase-modifying factor enzyme 1